MSDDRDIQPISIGMRLPDAYDEPRVVKSAKVDGGYVSIARDGHVHTHLDLSEIIWGRSDQPISGTET